MVDPITLGAVAAIGGSALVGVVRRRFKKRTAMAAASSDIAAEAMPSSVIDASGATGKQLMQPAPVVTPVVSTAKNGKDELAELRASVGIGKHTIAPDVVFAPAFPNLVKAGPTVWQALVDVSFALGLSPFALATVIQSESEWDATVPQDVNGKRPKGTPRAGLIQLTEGAHLPPWTSAEAVWAVRQMAPEAQLYRIAFTMMKRFGKMLDRSRNSTNPEDAAFSLYKLNFLPGDAGKPEDYKLGEKDSKEPLHKGSKVTRHDVWRENPGFAGGRPYFTWANVRERVKQVIKMAKGQGLTMSGKIVPMPTQSTTPQTHVVPAQAGRSGPTFAQGATCTVAPAIRVLLKQIDELFPKRLKTSDGLCGDEAHQKRKSDHNDGNAIDITLDPENGPNLVALGTMLLEDPRANYWIFNEQIASRETNNRAPRGYPIEPANRGKVNPHTRHLHFSIKPTNEVRESTALWPLDAAKLREKNKPASKALGSEPSIAGAAEALLNPVGAWKAGLVDNIRWMPLTIGEYQVWVATDCLAAFGQRLAWTFADCIAICKGWNMLPNTKAIVDARWASGDRLIVNRTRPPNNKYYDKILVAETAEWSKKIGPIRTDKILAGPWKEWVLDDVKTQGQATNYGLWGINGKPIQTLGHRHNDKHVDDTQMFAPVRRDAKRKGETVDLLDELAKGCPLGGPLPPWLVTALRSQ